MLTVDDYGAIRRAYRDRKSIRAIAREFGHSRKTIRHVLKHGEPNPGPSIRNRPAPVLGPFVVIVDQILVDDEEALPSNATPPCKCFVASRTNTATGGCYGQVQRYVRKHRRRHRETFIPWGTSQATVSRRISATSMSTFPTDGGSSRFWSPPGPTPTHPSFWRSPSAHRGNPGRHGRRLRVL